MESGDAVGLVVWKVYNVALQSLCSSFTDKLSCIIKVFIFVAGYYKSLPVLSSASSVNIPFPQLSFCQIFPSELLMQVF